MGCTNSKLDDLPAVALCRDRCTFLDEAIHQRYALAEAHLAYLRSLKTVGLSFDRFFDRDLHLFSAEPPSPVLNLPPHRKADPQLSDSPKKPHLAAAPPPAIHHHSHSHSGSHLRFHSDSDSDSDDSGSPSLHHDHPSDSPSPLHHYAHMGYADNESLGFPTSFPVAGGFMQMNYMRKQPTPSVSYQQRPMSPEIVHMGEASTSYFPYSNASGNNNNLNQNPTFYPPYYNYSSYGSSFPGSSPPQMMPYYGASSPSVIGISGASTSKEPPPPPSPPGASAWDFLNPFENFDKYYPPYTPSRDSRDVREEEGIPDLEEDYYQQEIVKEVHGDQKFVDSSGRVSYSKAEMEDGDEDEDEDEKVENLEHLHRSRPNVGTESDPVEYEVRVVDKKVVDDEERSGIRGNAAGFKARARFKGDSEVVKEIQVQFDRASESGSELAKILEVGKVPHNRKHAAYQVSSKMLQAISPSLSIVASQPSTSKAEEIHNVDPVLDVEGDLNLRSRSLSSTLHKLYLWEKKLYQEVKVEEKMRVLHERKVRKLKHLDERGAEAHKVDTTRALVRSLSTKIRIAIQVVDKISVKINTLRDDELWPQLNEFLQGLVRMWKSMLECHLNQCQAIREAKNLDAVASPKHFNEAHLEATSQLGHEIVNWTIRFSCWVTAQKGYVRALNNWLMKCLLYVPEETPDGIAPFSPGRIGAPPVFVICNQWYQALESVSEKEVVNCMRIFARSVLQLREQDKVEIRQRMTENKDIEKKVRNLEREDLKIKKEIQALDKKMLLVSGDDNGLALGQVVYQSETSKSGSLQVNLLRIFEAMERFSASSLKVYEDLLQRIEEDWAGKVP